MIAYSELGRRARPPTIARLMTLALDNPRLLSLAAGFTDNQTLPVGLVSVAVATLARENAADPEHLQYGMNQGRLGLRRQLAQLLLAREPALAGDPVATESRFLITNGSQQALYLAMQVLCSPGDIVLVDRPSYFVFLEMLAGLGIEARSLPTTASGELDRAGLRGLLATMQTDGSATRLKAVYFVSYFSNPSGHSQSAEEKSIIAEELAAADLIIPAIEDAAYRDLYFAAPHAVPSILSLPAWTAFPRLYTSTLTKPFATGLKVGYATCTDPEWQEKMLHVKGHHDFGSTNFNQAICEHALAAGAYEAHLTQHLRPAYERKMQVLHAALAAGGLCERGWRWEQPAGGLYLWLEAPASLDTGLDSAFCRACVAAGVLYVPGDLCFGDRPAHNFVRLSYGVLSEANLAEAARRFCSQAG
jgi:2-aminoadipate transaminase